MRKLTSGHLASFFTTFFLELFTFMQVIKQKWRKIFFEKPVFFEGNFIIIKAIIGQKETNPLKTWFWNCFNEIGRKEYQQKRQKIIHGSYKRRRTGKIHQRKLRRKFDINQKELLDWQRNQRQKWKKDKHRLWFDRKDRESYESQ